MISGQHKFQGVSGAWYEFAMGDLPTSTFGSCGVYIFAKRQSNGLYDVLYIGRASKLCDRLTDKHEKFLPARRLGMTTLGQTPCANDVQADYVERDLVAQFNPPLNRQLRSDTF